MAAPHPAIRPTFLPAGRGREGDSFSSEGTARKFLRGIHLPLTGHTLTQEKLGKGFLAAYSCAQLELGGSFTKARKVGIGATCLLSPPVLKR